MPVHYMFIGVSTLIQGSNPCFCKKVYKKQGLEPCYTFKKEKFKQTIVE